MCRILRSRHCGATSCEAETNTLGGVCRSLTKKILQDITLSLDHAPFDDSLTLDLPSVLPDHLAGGEEARLTQSSQGIDAISLPGGGSRRGSQASSLRSEVRKSASLDLPDHISMASGSISNNLDDFSDLLQAGSPHACTHPHACNQPALGYPSRHIPSL